jgi:antitoxin component HigA of HigAB toxin-antitoxin module
MKVKSFKEHLESRLNEKDIAEIESAAQMEYKAIQALRDDISKAIIQYMSKNDVGFNDLVRKLGKSPSQVSKIIKGEANLTITSIAQIFAIIGKMPHIKYG